MGQTNLYYSEMESPVGPLLIIETNGKVIRIDYGSMADLEPLIHKWANRYFDQPVFIGNPQKADHVIRELNAYFHDGGRNFTFSFEFHGTPFQKEVWQALVDYIPYGETKSYKEIAELIKKPKAMRAVGGAVNKNPFSIVVPCHRVVGANGKMVGYNGGLDKKAYLLNHEQGECIKNWI